MCDLIGRLTPAQAKEVVRRLSQASGEIRQAVVSEALNVLRNVEMDDIADEIFLALDSIDVQNCWAQSGDSRTGYISPDEAAQEIIEEEVQPYLDQMRRYHELHMPDQEATYCMAAILGLYRFEQESGSQFREWSTDIPAECASFVLQSWRKNQLDEARPDAMLRFVRDRCPAWTCLATGE